MLIKCKIRVFHFEFLNNQGEYGCGSQEVTVLTSSMIQGELINVPILSGDMKVNNHGATNPGMSNL